MKRKTGLSLKSAITGTVIMVAAMTQSTPGNAAEMTVMPDRSSGSNVTVAVYRKVPAAKRAKGNAAVAAGKVRVSELSYRECT